MNFKSNLIYLWLAIQLLAGGSIADHFDDVLHSIRAEAQAQQIYFEILSDEYVTDSSSLLTTPEHELSLKQKKELVEMVNSYYMALNSHHFWLVLRDSLDIILAKNKELEALTTRPSHEFLSSQNALEFLLEQLSRAGLVSFSDLVEAYDQMAGRHQQMPRNIDTIKLALSCTRICAHLGKIGRENKEQPDANAHMNTDIDDLARLFKTALGSTDMYRVFFIDYKALHSVFNSLKPFYKSTPIKGQGKIDFRKDRTKWGDLIGQAVEARARIDSQNFLFDLGKHQRSDREKLMPELLKLFKPQFLEKVKRVKENYKKRKKAQEKSRMVLVEVEKESANQDQAENDPVAPPVPEQKTEPADEEKGLSFDDEDLPFASYTDWTRDQRALSAAKKEASATASSIKKIRLSEGAAKVYRTALGLGSYQVTNRDLQEFLADVGGGFVKCSGPHSDRKIALPNFSQKATQDLLVGKMHLMHSGSDTYPISRLRRYLGRMIRSAGLDQAIALDG